MTQSAELDALRGLVRLLVHDLRNPLGAVMTNLEFARGALVEKGALDVDVGEALADSQLGCEVLRLLLGNLEVLGSEANWPIFAQRFAMEPLCIEVLERHQARAHQVGVVLAYEASPITRPTNTDRRMLALVLDNLISNAIQHAPRGTTVTFSVREDRGRARVAVVDRGAAIAPELRSLALSASGQLGVARSVGTRYGRGAGLHAAKVVADRLGVELLLSGDGATSELAALVELEPV
ncbi:MAG: sensor histidine kinase [Myxococcales bacterium]|nr:sensor histidine kinase [Myxococcales bacterium]